MFCKICGSELKPDTAFCPNCGACLNNNQNFNAYTSSTNSEKQKPFSALSILGIVFSSISLWDSDGIICIAGITLSILGLLQCRTGERRGKAAAITGIALSGAALLYLMIN